MNYLFAEIVGNLIFVVLTMATAFVAAKMAAKLKLESLASLAVALRWRSIISAVYFPVHLGVNRGGFGFTRELSWPVAVLYQLVSVPLWTFIILLLYQTVRELAGRVDDLDAQLARRANPPLMAQETQRPQP